MFPKLGTKISKIAIQYVKIVLFFHLTLLWGELFSAFYLVLSQKQPRFGFAQRPRG